MLRDFNSSNVVALSANLVTSRRRCFSLMIMVVSLPSSVARWYCTSRAVSNGARSARRRSLVIPCALVKSIVMPMSTLL